MPGPKWLWAVLLTLVSVTECCYGCSKQERVGLLQLKAWFNHPNGNSLQDWVDNKQHNADCCKWSGVECDRNTTKVIRLYINYSKDWRLWHLYLNASLFLPFKELKSLDLSSNQIAGWAENQGFKVLAKSRHLENLNMRDNYLNDSSLFGLNENSSLKSLDLSKNMFSGWFDINGFKLPRNLKFLDLSYNHFNDNIISYLSGLSSLKSLDLSYNSLTGSNHMNELYNMTNLEELFLENTSTPVDFPRNIGVLSALKVLSLGNSYLNHDILSPQGSCKLKNLEELYLFGNRLEGPLPACLANLSSLRVFDVTDNKFTGNIASGPLTNLTLLEYISLSSNQFQVPVSFRSFMNHSNLKLILFDNNKLIADPTKSETFVPKFQLQYFSLSNCSSSVQFPDFLYNQYDLLVLDLSHNNFGGMFPSWLLENNTKLKEVYLNDNSFEGPLQLPNHPNSNLSSFHISNNDIHGQIPRNMCVIFPSLIDLVMANSGFTGSIPPCFENISSLVFLDLSDNNLSGGVVQLSTLWFYSLSNNNLDGQIPPSVLSSSLIKYLYLNGNIFRGQIMDVSWNSSSSLRVLDISDNKLSGRIPTWIGNMSILEAIDASKNHFEGSIPAEICELQSLSFLDLSVNNLSVSLPFCFNQTHITHLHMSENLLIGPFKHAFFSMYPHLVTLDLADNNLIGLLPSWIGNLTRLSVLLLKDNHFEGDLPIQLCLLQQLSILDLSENSFSGPVPSCLSNLTFEATSAKAPFPTTFFTQKTMRKSYLDSPGRATTQKHPYFEGDDLYQGPSVEEVVEFTTKRRSYAYEGITLIFMAGIDLSRNKFTGEIPQEIGNLDGIRALNLSHNNLTGFIPVTFSNLKQIESLDLSYNHLNGRIPQQLAQLYSLAVFSVAYNNLSGKIPEMNQFWTFDKNSYEGNPFLCGPPLQKNCTKLTSNDSNGESEDAGFIDMDVFYISFGVAYTIVALGIAAILYINPYWSRIWFYFVETFVDMCFNVVLDHFHIRSYRGS